MGERELFEAAKAEETRLEAELRKLPIYQQLQSVQGLIATYRAANPDLKVTVVRYRPQHETAGTKTARILDACAKILTAKKARATSTELAKGLEAYGIDINFKHLSSYLSNAKDVFDNDTNDGGYGLVAWRTARAAE